MSRRVHISNDSLNSYGTRALTSGMNVGQHCRNSVLLYMHERGNVIGYVKDVEMESDGVTGELVFDETTELSRWCKRQFELDSLKMVSADLDIVEIDGDSAYLIAGQIGPTITRSKLLEVPVVDIGASDDAPVLKRDGKRITLGRDGECPLPELSNNNQKTRNKMENKAIALQLGLSGTAINTEIMEKTSEFKTAKEESEGLREERDELTLTSVASLAEKAIGKKRITTGKKDEFISLGKEIGMKKLASVSSTMSPQVELSVVLGQHRTTKTDVPVTYKKLSKAPGDKLLEIREQQPGEYKRLYKAEYGTECEI